MDALISLKTLCIANTDDYTGSGRLAARRDLFSIKIGPWNLPPNLYPLLCAHLTSLHDPHCFLHTRFVWCGAYCAGLFGDRVNASLRANY